MSTGAEYEKQFSDSDQNKNDTFTGKPVEYQKAAKFNPALDGAHDDRSPSTKND